MMAQWICHPHPDLRHWVVRHARIAHPGLLQSFEAACEHATKEQNWGDRSGQYAFVDYLPGLHPFTYPMMLKLRIESAYLTAVGVLLERENLAFRVE